MGSQQFPFEQELKTVAPPPKGILEQIFYNKAGLRSGWRLLLFTAIFVTLEIFSEAVIRTFIRPAPAALTPAYLLLVEIARFIVLLLTAYLMSRIEMRRLGVYGLPLAGWSSKRFLQGGLAGLSEISILIGLIASFGGYSFGSLALRGAEIIEWLVLWAVIFVFVGLSEEFAFRGYAQFTLADGIGFWPAAVILSAGFGIVHLDNGGEKWFGVLSIFFIGLVFALALRRTGNLWFVVGFHAAFDFGETFLFSVPNSGMRFTGHLSHATLNGPAWLTGGSTGPEGSVFSFLTMGCAALAIHLAFPAKKPAAAENAAPR
ncbi:MAG TPA: type II CAAX endopeptidase family protein [Candidatus Saccharimonadales bacterium]|nr:type II CAAX endopeptidase family protein [Candidatus Saccharimonadales bacterium]